MREMLMGKLYDTYEKLKLENNMKLIYTLAAIQTNLNFHYSVKKGDGFNQFCLNTRAKGSDGENSILLQATQWDNEKIDISIQVLAMIEKIKNHIDCGKKDEHDVFMEYLKYF